MITHFLTATVDLIETSKVLTALTAIGGVGFGVFKFLSRNDKQDEAIKALQAEQKVICSSLVAVMGGLEQLGADKTVTNAKNELIVHLNDSAHR